MFGFVVEIYYDARPYESQICLYYLLQKKIVCIKVKSVQLRHFMFLWPCIVINVQVTVHREQSVKKEYQQDATI